ncbi:MAG TPA: CehA/McbA family metallohydrolase [Candidatus Sulfotelmatobacter sp.]|nr:CehA/McbA family metallohydrolase [Candidatus Sulfotelmatobacter sp.]
MRLISEHRAERPASLDREWPAVVTHTHNWRFREGEAAGSFSAAEEQLVRWCQKLGIRAVGVGSAWNPANEANFQRFEGPDRDLYYSGKFDQKSVMDVAGVNATLADLNERSHGSTLFYLDNETPKNRMGHMWWFGYLYDDPAWHDYSQDRPIKYYENDPAVEINPLSGEPHTRRNLFEIMAIQRKAGAIGVFAHPTRWWVSDGKFTSNIAAMSGLFLIADGSIDGMAVMGDRVYNKSYEDLWFWYLDTGGKVPGFAETDFFLNQASQHNQLDTFRNYPHIGNRPLTAQAIRDVARSGEVFFSDGGFLNVSVDGVPMGSVVQTAPAKRHRLRIEVYAAPNSSVGRIEIIGKHGVVLAVKDKFPGGVLEYEIPGRGDPDYVVVRAFGAGDDPEHDPDHVRYLAVSNPVYLWPKGFHPEAARTFCTIRVASGSQWIGGTLEFQTADGQRIRREAIHAGKISASVPADSRVVLSKAGVRSRMFYIAMENAEVEKDISYLSSGEFRKDYPGLAESVVPPKAFRLESLRQALQRFEYEIQ